MSRTYVTTNDAGTPMLVTPLSEPAGKTEHLLGRGDLIQIVEDAFGVLDEEEVLRITRNGFDHLAAEYEEAE